jgi:hypothetical protein
VSAELDPVSMDYEVTVKSAEACVCIPCIGFVLSDAVDSGGHIQTSSVETVTYPI